MRNFPKINQTVNHYREGKYLVSSTNYPLITVGISQTYSTIIDISTSIDYLEPQFYSFRIQLSLHTYISYTSKCSH